MSDLAPLSVVEMPEFLAKALKLMDEEERGQLVDYLACNPTAGDLIAGTGGVRKVRWALEGRGKRGGARVIYFYHNADMPLILLTVYAKNQQADLSAADKNDFRRMTKHLVEHYGKADR